MVCRSCGQSVEPGVFHWCRVDAETIRDRDARAAMAAYIQNPTTAPYLLANGIPVTRHEAVVSESAFRMADAMAEARKREEE